MNKLCYLLLLIAFVTSYGCKKETNSANLPADNKQWQVYTTANSKLPNNQVNAIAIDKNGVKWIGTGDGLAKLVGSNWTIFNNGNSPLPSSYIKTLAAEDDGTVWFGTDKGLAKNNGTNWEVYTKANSVMTANNIMCITYDITRKKTWVATEKELISIDSNNTWQRFDALEDELILSMATDKDGALWLGTFYHFAFRGRIRKFNNNVWTTYQLDQMGYPSTFPYGLAVDESNAVYAVLTGTSVRSVVRYDGGTWQEVSRPECATGLKSILVEGNNIWVGGKTLSRFGTAATQCLSIPGEGSNIQAIALDDSGQKWLGTVDGGVVVYKD